MFIGFTRCALEKGYTACDGAALLPCAWTAMPADIADRHLQKL
jgi:hypothetical protein